VTQVSEFVEEKTAGVINPMKPAVFMFY